MAQSKQNAAPQPDKQSAQAKFYPIILSDTADQAATSFLRGYRLFWPFLRPFWPMALLGIVLTIPVGALDAVIAAFLKPFTDQVMVAQKATFAAYVPAVIIVFTLVQGIFIYLSSLINGWVGGKINLLMRTKLYHKLLSFDTSFYDANNSGSVIFRFYNDAESASRGLISNIKLFLTKLFSSISLCAVLLYNSWELFCCAIGVLVFLILPLRIVRRRIKKIIARSVQGNTSIITLYNETTQGNRVIKAFSLQNLMKKTFQERADFIFRMNINLVRDTNWLSPVMHLVSAIGVALVLYFGLHLILTGQITSGSFVAFLAALIMLYTPLKTIGNNFISVQQALLALDRIYQLLNYHSFEEESAEGKQTLESIKQGIEFKDVHFSYRADREILKGVSFKVPVGRKLALVGNSGGGKTTVCSLIPRLYDIDAGSITIDGVDIRDFTLESLRSQIAVVFQDSFLFQGTIRDNITCAKPDATDEEIAQALERAYLTDFVASLKDGINTQIGERGISLSGGQKQRISIARALIRNAPIVILDEATSALDNKSEKVVQQALDELMRGRTTIVIAHRLSTIRDADEILVVNDGLIVEQGTHEELLRKGGAYAALYMSQFKSREDEIADINNLTQGQDLAQG
ncbi:MAG: ATP-binding cassette domain-containing protein [Candidatus Anaerobiospirillum merdipullorum]|uniref:ATP-binding cassette domain-containing protein n=1 Tax=Candidatus Anaerobiospirillum merdipullorum TaxID=2838450 RepID=A0A9E2KN65_9GAMM|nr:ATP-binding cassette domain-containing protein [Candidatus Anaerobiospirillum merdipullorum]